MRREAVRVHGPRRRYQHAVTNTLDLERLGVHVELVNELKAGQYRLPSSVERRLRRQQPHTRLRRLTLGIHEHRRRVDVPVGEKVHVAAAADAHGCGTRCALATRHERLKIVRDQ